MNSVSLLDAKLPALPMYIEQIKEYLPHRYPLLLIDRVLEITPGQTIHGYKNLSANEEFLQGHFPELPLMPGVLIVEAMAQLSGILSLVSVGRKPSDGLVFFFGGIDKVRFKKQIVAGDQIHLYAEFIIKRHTMHKFKCKAEVDGKLAATAEIMLCEQELDLA